MNRLLGILVIAYLAVCVGCCFNASKKESMVDIDAVSTFAQQRDSPLLANGKGPVAGFDILESEPGEIVPSPIGLPLPAGDEDEDEDEDGDDNEKQIVNLR